MTLSFRTAQPGDIPVVCTFAQSSDEAFFFFPKCTWPLTPEQLAAAVAQRSDSSVVVEGDEVLAFANFYQWEQGGWVPGQVIRILAAGQGVALEDYTARELDVDSGQRVFGARQMNGWVWCSYVEPEGLIAGNARSHKVGTELKSGWVPFRNLQPA